jgi:hypothetical protein
MAAGVVETRKRYTACVIYFHTLTCFYWIWYRIPDKNLIKWISISAEDFKVLEMVQKPYFTQCGGGGWNPLPEQLTEPLLRNSAATRYTVWYVKYCTKPAGTYLKYSNTSELNVTYEVSPFLCRILGVKQVTLNSSLTRKHNFYSFIHFSPLLHGVEEVPLSLYHSLEKPLKISLR